MSLIEQQRLLAGLYTSKKAREDYFKEVASSEENKKELIVFAQGLLLKRLNVVKNIFSLSFAYNNSLLYDAFIEYASVNTMQGFHLKHTLDALAFFKYLKNKKIITDYLLALMSYEAHSAKSFLPGKQFLFLKSNYHFSRATTENITKEDTFKGYGFYLLVRLSVNYKWFEMNKEF